MAGYAGVEFAAAEVLDGDDVEWGRVVGTLRQRGQGEAENLGRRWDFCLWLVGGVHGG